MKWYRETFYIQRDESTGAIIRMQEDKPHDYKPTSDVEKSIKDYAKLKAKKKRLEMGE